MMGKDSSTDRCEMRSATFRPYPSAQCGKPVVAQATFEDGHKRRYCEEDAERARNSGISVRRIKVD